MQLYVSAWGAVTNLGANVPEISAPNLITIFGCAVIFMCFWWSSLSVGRVTSVVLHAIAALQRRLPQPNQLTAQWERYSQEVEKYPALWSMWQDYRSTIVETGDRLRSLRPATTCLLGEGLALNFNAQLHGAMPNLLTGMGIFFTFCGLIIGIGGAEKSVTATDHLGRTAALETLLGGAHLAFWTSAGGLFLSLVLSAFSKRRWHQVDHSCAAWARGWDRLIPPLTAAEVAYQQLEVARASTKQLERFNTELATSIASALDESQARWLQPMLKELIAAADAMHKNQVNFDKRLSEELLRKFEAVLTGSAQSKIEQMASAMSTAAQHLSASSSTLADQQARWTEEMGAVASELRGAVDAAATAMGQGVAVLLQTVDQTLAGVHARLQAGVSSAVNSIQESGASVSGQLQAAANDLRAVLGEVHAATEKVSEAANAFAASKSAFASLAPGLKAATQGVSAAAAQITTTMQSASHLHGELLATAQTIKHEHGQLAQLLANFEARFGQVDRSAQGLFKEINEGLGAFTNQVREFLGHVDGHLAQASSTLGQAIGELMETIEDFSEISGQEQ